MSSLKNKILFNAMFDLSRLMVSSSISNQEINTVSKKHGLSKSELNELKRLYIEMHRATPMEEITDNDRLNIIEKILYPEKENGEEEKNLEKAISDARKMSTDSLCLRSAIKRLSLRYNLKIAEEENLKKEVKKILEERENEKVDISSFCEEIIKEYLENPKNIQTLIEKKAKQTKIEKKELESLLIQELINLKSKE